MRRRRRRIGVLVVLCFVLYGGWWVYQASRDAPEVDGPVISRRALWSDDDTDDGFGGVVQIHDRCIVIDGSAVVWPHGTSWDEGEQAVRTTGGALVHSGDHIESGIGYLPSSTESFLADEDVQHALGGCEVDDVVVLVGDVDVRPG